MREHFEKQIEESVPLSQDRINHMKQTRIDSLPRHLKDDMEKITPKSSFDTVFEVNDIVLYFAENIDGDAHINSVLLRELDKLNMYDFVQMDNKMPILKKTIK